MRRPRTIPDPDAGWYVAGDEYRTARVISMARTHGFRFTDERGVLVDRDGSTSNLIDDDLRCTEIGTLGPRPMRCRRYAGHEGGHQFTRPRTHKWEPRGGVW